MTRVKLTHLYAIVAIFLLMNYGQGTSVGQNKNQENIQEDWSLIENEVRDFAELLEQSDEEIMRKALLQIGNEQNDILFALKLDLYARKFLKTSFMQFSKGPYTYYIGDRLGYNVSEKKKLSVWKEVPCDNGLFGFCPKQVMKQKVPAIAVVDRNSHVFNCLPKGHHPENILMALEEDLILIDLKNKYVIWEDAPYTKSKK